MRGARWEARRLRRRHRSGSLAPDRTRWSEAREAVDRRSDSTLAGTLSLVAESQRVKEHRILGLEPLDAGMGRCATGDHAVEPAEERQPATEGLPPHQATVVQPKRSFGAPERPPPGESVIDESSVGTATAPGNRSATARGSSGAHASDIAGIDRVTEGASPTQAPLSPCSPGRGTDSGRGPNSGWSPVHTSGTYRERLPAVR